MEKNIKNSFNYRLTNFQSNYVLSSKYLHSKTKLSQKVKKKKPKACLAVAQAINKPYLRTVSTILLKLVVGGPVSSIAIQSPLCLRKLIRVCSQPGPMATYYNMYTYCFKFYAVSLGRKIGKQPQITNTINIYFSWF